MAKTDYKRLAARIAASCCTTSRFSEATREIEKALELAHGEGLAAGRQLERQAQPVNAVGTHYTPRPSKLPASLETVDWSGVVREINRS